VAVGIRVGEWSAAICCPKNCAAIANCDASQRVTREGNIINVG
jgi:hypothetical protein